LAQPRSSANHIQCSIYPNPSAGKFTLAVKSHCPGIFNIEIINASGVIVYNDKVMNRCSRLEKHVDLSSAPAGIYLVRISSDKCVLNKRVVLY
jgi:hypothetical protein